MLVLMARGLLFGASVLLAAGNELANPIDDCNQSADAKKQIDGCTRFLEQDPFGPYARSCL
jgi:hypothetical protein